MKDDGVHPKSHWVRHLLFSVVVFMSLATLNSLWYKGVTLASFTGKMLRVTTVGELNYRNYECLIKWVKRVKCALNDVRKSRQASLCRFNRFTA